MTPNARYAAAIGILDAILDGNPADKTLTNWARNNRYAGSKDRAAVRDIVFECLRKKRSFGHVAGFGNGRGLAVGHILDQGMQPRDVFTGEKFAPEGLRDDELAAIDADKVAPTTAIKYNIPDWIEAPLQTSLGDAFEPTLEALQDRAPLDLRVNFRKASVEKAQDILRRDDIETEDVDGIKTALRVKTNPRRVALSHAYDTGVVEIQDAGSQAVASEIELPDAGSVLDYCAGGGGKSLALAALAPNGVDFSAYDQNTNRMKDISKRAGRAGVVISVLDGDPVTQDKTYDLVVLDVPCSGTGAWRRNPDGKWRLTASDVADYCEIQKQILDKTHGLVGASGTLAYITCSLLEAENHAQIDGFLVRNPEWKSILSRQMLPSHGTDGLYLNILKRQL